MFTKKELAEGARGRALVAEMVQAMAAALAIPPREYTMSIPLQPRLFDDDAPPQPQQGALLEGQDAP